MRHVLMLLCLTAPLGAAACPTGADLVGGIRLTDPDGVTETFREMQPGVVRGLYTLDDTTTIRNLLGQGVYLLEVVDLENGAPVPDTRSTYSFPIAPADMPRPTPNGGWTTKVATLIDGSLGSETQVYSFGALTTQTYGACSYNMIPITVSFPPDPSDYRDTLHYLPALGFSYLAESAFTENGERNVDRYSYVTIEALR